MGFLDCVNGRVAIPGMTDTESEDSDDHLLVDWKGNGGRVSLVQQSLPFKQVKRRDGLKTTSASKVTHTPTSAPRTISTGVTIPVREDKPVDVEPLLNAVKPKPEAVSRPKVVVSLSDSDVSAPPRSAIKRPDNNSHRLNQPGSPSFTFSICCMSSKGDLGSIKLVY